MCFDNNDWFSQSPDDHYESSHIFNAVVDHIVSMGFPMENSLNALQAIIANSLSFHGYTDKEYKLAMERWMNCYNEMWADLPKPKKKEENSSALSMEFYRWAFGDTWISYLCLEKDVFDLLESWNIRHGNLLYIENWDDWQESVKKMKNHWEVVLEKNKKKM